MGHFEIFSYSAPFWAGMPCDEERRLSPSPSGLHVLIETPSFSLCGNCVQLSISLQTHIEERVSLGVTTTVVRCPEPLVVKGLDQMLNVTQCRHDAGHKILPSNFSITDTES